MQARSCFLAVLIVTAFSAPIVLNFQVEPQKEDCIYEDVQVGQDIDASVLVYRGGKLDVKLRIESPEKLVLYNQLLFSNVDDKTGKLLNTIVKKGHKFKAPSSGTYTFCVDNRMAKWTAKVVTFELDKTVGGNWQERFVKLADNAEGTLKVLKESATRVYAKLLMVENAQYYHYHRELRHLETQDSTSGRVIYWTFTESAVILLLTACQIFIIRTWFSNSKQYASGGLPGGRLGV